MRQSGQLPHTSKIQFTEGHLFLNRKEIEWDFFCFNAEKENPWLGRIWEKLSIWKNQLAPIFFLSIALSRKQCLLFTCFQTLLFEIKSFCKFSFVCLGGSELRVLHWAYRVLHCGQQGVSLRPKDIIQLFGHFTDWSSAVIEGKVPNGRH